MSKKLCTYIVRTDKNLAPNPFWNYCTLAVCTPNRMGIKFDAEEFWICGFSQKEFGHKLIFAMKVLQVLDFDLYYSDPRFTNKKPNINGSWQEKVGDNMYYKDSKSNWVKHPSGYHNEKEIQEKDVRYHQVYIAEHFYYFGESAVSVNNAEYLVPLTHGVKCNHEEELKNTFIDWIQKEFKVGVIGLPRDRFMEIKDCDVNQHHPMSRQPSMRAGQASKCAPDR